MSETRALKRILMNLEHVKQKADECDQNVEINEIKAYLAILNDEWRDFQTIEKSLDGRFSDIQLESVNKIETAYFKAKQVLYRYEKGHVIENVRGNISMDDLMANQTQFVHELSVLNKRDCEVRLPRVNIPPFSGDYSEFPSFKDLFEASVDKNENISNVHKLQYLKGLLKGEAYSLIRHLTVTDANYTQAWEKIKDRYNKPKHVVYNLLKQFMDQPMLQQSSAKGLRHLTDVSDEVIRGLHVLGKPAEGRDPLLIYLLVNKLDAESKEAWAHVSIKEDFPSLGTFFQFLSKRSDALECLNVSQKSKVSVPKRIGAMVTQAEITSECPMCSGDHYIGRCSKYLELPITERKEIVSNRKLCFNCLSTTHQAGVCRSKYSCRICRRKHHVTLHLESKKEANSDDQNVQGTSDSTKATGSSVYVSIKAETGTEALFQAILPTAIVLVEDNYGQLQHCRALLDSGSQSSFISENCAQRLQLKREKANISISGLTSGNLQARGKSTIVLRSMYDSKRKTVLQVLIIKHLPTHLPKTKINLQNKQFAKELNLADPHFDTPSSIDLLIGADKFFEILENNQRRYNSIILNKTVFGWVVSGQPRAAGMGRTETFNIYTQENVNLDQTLRKFFEIEDMPNINKLTPEEIQCENLFVSTHKRRDDGRYIVKLPFKEDTVKLGDSLQAATNRFRSLERKLSANPKLRDEYIKQMREYICLGHMVELPVNYNNKQINYLPHNSVTKESSSTTKTRVVFDGSNKTTNGLSLNDNLMVGPTIQPTLWAILLKFRTNKIALIADIEKMYRQVIISEEHRSYQTILWREKPDDMLKHYHLTRVTFGLACSAFLAIRAMQQLAMDSKDESIKNHILNDFYVDDLLTGSNDVEQATALKEKISSTLLKGGFCLRKWTSNIRYLSDTTNEIPISDLCRVEASITKTLGLQWQPMNDTFTFKIQAERDGAISKRKLISESSRIFDPLGFLSPSIILLKILFQKLWLLKLDWDQRLPSEIEDEYRIIRNQFIHFENINIPRFTNHNGEIQIHGFADASEVAYCAVVYSRVVDVNGSIITQLLTSKTKVAPIKKISLPRLELCAAHLLVKLLSAVKEALQIEAQYFAWTDSEIVLAWLSTYPVRWKTFIANRTSLILESFPRQCWAHVKSKDNPADHGSRGVTPEKLVNLTHWWKGPIWLMHPQESWPVSDKMQKFQEPNHNMEYSTSAISTITLHTECNQHIESWIDELFENEFRLQKTFRVVAYVLRFINILKNPKWQMPGQLTAAEIHEAKTKCIIWVQQMEFGEDIQSIQRHKRVTNKSRLLSLAPFIDENGILRVGGRLENSDCAFDSKHPIILPQKHIFTTRVIWDIHLSKLHAGPTLTSNHIRQNYWIINGRGRIRSIIKRCVICARYAAKTTKQMMGNLPATRVTPTRPFENCGVDFAGPIYIAARKGRGRINLVKGYICVFVCLAVKAVHIEAVTDLTSEAFLAALKRFAARRGVPKRIYTDNGSNFIGARRILEQACKLIKEINNNYVIAEFLSQNNIEWHFIPPVSPHFGGLWEAAVKSVKSHLLKATHKINLTFEEMTTLLCQIENILNSRPLYTSTTDDNYEVLTPAHFLIGTSIASIPEPYIDVPENRLSSWQIIQRRIQSFWKRYYLEYLNNLQQRNKWQRDQENIKVGDIVLIKEDYTPAGKWPFGRIIQVHPGKDDLVRAVTIKTSSSILQRPVVKLCKLPVG